MTEQAPSNDASGNTPDENEPTYEVGYGKPPKHSQFKAGNKRGKGRPRGARNLGSMVRDLLGKRVAVKLNGTSQKLTVTELALKQIAHKAMAGDLKAAKQLIELAERHLPPEDDGPIPDDEIAYDLETLAHHLRMMGDPDDE